MNQLKIEYIPIDAVKAYPGNAKIHTAEQIEQIKRSIQQFGFRDPVAVWNGEIVEGHGRIIAATELGIKEIPIIRLDDMTDEERRAYALVHNKLTMNTGFDFEILNMELEDLSFDMGEFGFDLEGEISEYTGNGVTEYDPEQFSDDKFECECPRCGFKFNR